MYLIVSHQIFLIWNKNKKKSIYYIFPFISDQYLLHQPETDPLSPESGRNGNSNGSGNGNTAGHFLPPGQQLMYRSTATQASLRNGSNNLLPSQHHVTHNNPASNSGVLGKAEKKNQEEISKDGIL